LSGELERLATACLFPGFDGLSPPDWVRRELGQGLGGVVLFARNVESTGQVAALTAALGAEREDVLVATDEEGGDVTRLEVVHGSSSPGNHALGAVDDVALTEQVGASIGTALSAAGVSLDLAPVADVNTNPSNPVIGIRSFGSDPELVARHVAAFVRGLQGVGVAACAKHFPGHGDTELDSHLALPTVATDRETLARETLLPFRAAIEAGVLAIMTAHIRVPAIDDAPATVSPPILQGLLREELGFDGLVITDALEMRGLSGSVGVEEGAVLALVAGADALCLGHDLGEAATASVREALVRAVRSGRLSEDRLRQAGARVAAVASRRGHAGGGLPAPDVGLDAARRALEAAGTVALERPPLVVELVPDVSIAAGPARHGLGDLLHDSEVIRLDRDSALPDGRRDRQLVLVVRDAHRHAWEQKAAEALLASADDAVVVEVGIPLWRPEGAAGYLATHGAGRANLLAAAERLLVR
jgi:beta-N-acetylhexosaminidase